MTFHTKTNTCAFAIGFGLLTAAAPSFAQTMASPHPGNTVGGNTVGGNTVGGSMVGGTADGTNGTTAPSMTPTRAGSSMTGLGASGPNGSLEQYHGMFRVSELNGANVYDEHGTTIGTVNDMLLGTDGRVQNVVLSVGGFLGVGTHYVSVPYSRLKVQPSRMGMIGATPTGATHDNGGMNGTASGASPLSNTAMGGVRTTDTTGAGHTQYFSVVLPGATRDSLKNMPEFRYMG